MRVLVDIRLLGRGGTSGIEEYTRNLLRELLTIDRDNDYTLFYNGFLKKPLEIATPRQGGARNDRVIDWKIPNKVLDFSSRFWGWPKVDDFVKADVVFSPHFNILSVGKAPRVITFHDLSFMHHPNFFSWKQRFWHWLQDVKRQAQGASKIIAVSEFTKSDLVNLLGVPPEKISVIYSGISEEFKKESGITNQELRPYILYLGTLEPRKNVPAIIRAFNILKKEPAFKDWQLVLAGKPGWLFKNVLKEAAGSHYKSDIIFKGSVSADERVSLYNLARVFVYPSFFEGFGFPPLEAQACGCPVIVSDRTSLPEVVGDGALLVNPWKVEDLAAAIREAALNSGLRGKLIDAGFKNARKFNWKNTAEKTLEVFRH